MSYLVTFIGEIAVNGQVSFKMFFPPKYVNECVTFTLHGSTSLVMYTVCDVIKQN